MEVMNLQQSSALKLFVTQFTFKLSIIHFQMLSLNVTFQETFSFCAVVTLFASKWERLTGMFVAVQFQTYSVSKFCITLITLNIVSGMHFCVVT